MQTVWLLCGLDTQTLHEKSVSIHDGNLRTGAIGGKPTPPQLTKPRLGMKEYVPQVLRARRRPGLLARISKVRLFHAGRSYIYLSEVSGHL